MIEGFLFYSTAWAFSLVVWPLLGVSDQALKWASIYRFVSVVLILAVATLLEMSLWRWLASALLLGCVSLPWKSRRLWGPISAVFFGVAYYLETLIHAYHGLGFDWNPRILVVLPVVLMLSLKPLIPRYLNWGILLLLFVGMSAW